MAAQGFSDEDERTKASTRVNSLTGSASTTDGGVSRMGAPSGRETFLVSVPRVPVRPITGGSGGDNVPTPETDPTPPDARRAPEEPGARLDHPRRQRPAMTPTPGGAPQGSGAMKAPKAEEAKPRGTVAMTRSAVVSTTDSSLLSSPATHRR